MKRPVAEPAMVPSGAMTQYAPRRTLSLNWRQFLVYIALITLALMFLVPIAVMINTALKSPRELMNVLALARSIHWGNFQDAWVQVGRGLFNSTLITIPAVLISVFLGAVTAYPLAQFRFKGDTIIFTILLSGMFLPFQAILVPLMLIMRQLGLYDTIPGMWLVHVAYGIPLCTFFMRNFFVTIPSTLFEAATVDGTTVAGYFFRVLLPLSRSGLAALAILQSRAIWNDLLFSLTLTSSTHVRPVTVDLSSFVGGTAVSYGGLMAGTLISVLPVTVFYMIFQREFVRGILAGSLKQ